MSFSNASRRERGLPAYNTRSAWRDAHSPPAASRQDALRYLAFVTLTVIAVIVVIAEVTLSGV